MFKVIIYLAEVAIRRGMHCTPGPHCLSATIAWALTGLSPRSIAEPYSPILAQALRFTVYLYCSYSCKALAVLLLPPALSGGRPCYSTGPGSYLPWYFQGLRSGLPWHFGQPSSTRLTFFRQPYRRPTCYAAIYTYPDL